MDARGTAVAAPAARADPAPSAAGPGAAERGTHEAVAQSPRPPPRLTRRPIPSALRRLLRRALLLFAVWSVPGAIMTLSVYVIYVAKDPASMTLARAFVWRFPAWQVWAVATPLIVALARRFPLSRPWPALPIHLAAATAIATGDVAVYALCGRLVGEEPFVSTPIAELLPWLLLKSALLAIFVYGLVVAADLGLRYQRRFRESAAQQARLEAQLAIAQLDALKLQLHPHFLFNTINAIGVLMRKGDAASAVKMLNGLADLLRRSLSRLRVELVPLREELDFIERYLDIETTRFPDRLRASFDIEPAALDAKVPNLLLQPLVENAIKHGIAPRARGGAIELVARVRGDRLAIEVRDDGVGLAAAAARPAEGAEGAEGHGLGLAHVRERLAQLYPGAHRFSLEPREPSGAVAALEIPLPAPRPVGAEPPAPVGGGA